MPSVFMMRHHSVLCAVPAAQVIAVRTDRREAGSFQLWRDARARPPERYLHFRTSQGERTVSCTDPRLVQLGATDVFALSTLVRREIGSLFVVGVARVTTDWIWLVYLGRL